MSVETRMVYSDQELSGFANDVKEIVVKSMAARGIITEEESTAFLERYAVLVVKKGWLGSMIDKDLNFADPKGKRLIIVDRE